MRTRTRCVAGVIALAVCLPLAALAESGGALSLAGSHRFMAGDSAAYADPDWPDSDWTPIQLPGSADAQGIDPEAGIGWLRLHFDLPESWRDRDLGVALGVVWGADEAFLDGVRIGGTGVLGDRPALPYLVDRVYAVPPGALRPGTHHVLALRIQNGYDIWGLVNGPIEIGRRAALADRAAQRTRSWVSIDALLIALNLAGIAVWAVFRRAGYHDRVVGYLAGALVGLLAVSVGGSVQIYGAGSYSSLVFALVVVGHQVGGPMAGAAAIHLVSDRRLRWMDVAFALFAAAWFWWAAFPSLALQVWLSEISFGLAGALVVLLAVEAIRARLRQQSDSGRVLMLSLAYAIAGVATLLAMRREAPADWEMRYVALPFIWLVPTFLTFQIGFGLGRTRRRMLELSRQVLSAQAEERQRLSRDLHDGVAQNLQAAKLGLQLASANDRDPAIVEATELVAKSIADLRVVAQDLRPLGAGGRSIQQAIREYVEVLAMRTGVRITLDAESEEMQLDPDKAEHLYRIAQEAIGNAIRHGAPRNVRVALEGSETGIRLRVEDDGAGFDIDRAEFGRFGIGLSTMRERAALMDGTCRITSDSGSTSIEVEIPSDRARLIDE